jgi:hypothetical protein
MNHRVVSITTDTAGAGTAVSLPISGVIHEISYAGTVLNQVAGTITGTGGTVAWTFTRDDGGTVLGLTAQMGPFRAAPRSNQLSLTGGITSAGTATALVPVDGNVKVVVGTAKPSATDTVTIYYAVR